MYSDVILTIVLPTLGRVKEVDALLESILKYVIPTKISFEVIVVDQNFSNLLDTIIVKYKEVGLVISHYKVSFRGLSKAKNFGGKLAKGKYICFVDDDAEFLPGTVQHAINQLEKNEFVVVSGRCVDRDGNDSILRFGHKEQALSLKCFENKFIETTMFFKREICERFQYDENMGVGAFYGAEEGYDLVYRMLSEEVKILFDPEIMFYHPHTIVSHSNDRVVKRAFTYRTGFGFLCKKHKLKKKYYKRLVSVLCYLPYLILLRPKDVRYYVGELLGLLVGKFI